jgi:hypothetical protein
MSEHLSDGQRRAREVLVLTAFLRRSDLSESLHDIACVLEDEAPRFASVGFAQRYRALQRFARLCGVDLTTGRDAA